MNWPSNGQIVFNSTSCPQQVSLKFLLAYNLQFFKQISLKFDR